MRSGGSVLNREKERMCGALGLCVTWRRTECAER